MNNEQAANRKYYETASLRFYRKKLEEKIAAMSIKVSIAPGYGAPVSVNKEQSNLWLGTKSKEQSNLWFGAENKENSGQEFLKQYLNDINALPQAEEKENYHKKLDEKQLMIVDEAIKMAKTISEINKISLQKAIEQISKIEPFSNEIIIEKILSKFENE